MKRIVGCALVMMALVLGVSTSDVGAAEFCESAVVRSWQTGRDAAAARLLELWLHRVQSDLVRAAGFELVRLEVLLAPCIPPLSLDASYLTDVTDPDPDRLPPAVFRAFLRRHGVRLDARDFLIGKTFAMPSGR